MKYALEFFQDAHLIALGNVAARAAQLDVGIEFTINTLLADRPSTAKHLLLNLPQGSIVPLLATLLADRFPHRAEEVTSFISRVTNARGRRNELLHQLWGASSNPGEAFSASLRPHRKRSGRGWTAPQIGKVADDLFECVKALHQWSELHETEPNPRGAFPRISDLLSRRAGSASLEAEGLLGLAAGLKPPPETSED